MNPQNSWIAYPLPEVSYATDELLKDAAIAATPFRIRDLRNSLPDREMELDTWVITDVLQPQIKLEF